MQATPGVTIGRVKKTLRDGAAIAAISLLLLLLLEGGLRLARRVSGQAAATRVEVFYAEMRQALAIYRAHPFTNTGARRGASVVAFGRSVVMNSRGYRSPERTLERPAGTLRVLCAGGSTTFDIGALDYAATWPALLEARLAAQRPGAEVWNAGFPGWTSAENLVSLALRDGDLLPDLVLLFQGINDLQPAAHVPFDPEYEAGHAAESRLALGLELRPIGWAERSLLLEKARDLLGQSRDPWARLKLDSSGPRLSRLPDAAVATFERNVRSFIALARSRGSRVLLVTQVLRPRQDALAADLEYLAGWLQGLEPSAAPAELERFNEVLRRQADEGVMVADPAREIAWEDADFADPMHTTAAGSIKLADYLAARVLGILSPE